jgi:hypothetical protein
LPQVPIGTPDACSSLLRFTVPVGSKIIDLRAQSADGRKDGDRLRLTCEPAQ